MKLFQVKNIKNHPIRRFFLNPTLRLSAHTFTLINIIKMEYKVQLKICKSTVKRREKSLNIKIIFYILETESLKEKKIQIKIKE